MSKLDAKTVSLSLASTAGILYIVCALLVAIAPETAVSLFKNIFHGIDITQIAKTDISLGNAIVGFIEIIVYSLIAGWLFTLVYNYIDKKIK